MPLRVEFQVELSSGERHLAHVTANISGRRVQLVGSCEQLADPSISRAVEKHLEPIAAQCKWDEAATSKALMSLQWAIGCPASCLSTVLFASTSSCALTFTVTSCSVVPAAPPAELVEAEKQLQRRLQSASDFKRDGVTLFSQKEYRPAINAFRSALRALEGGLLPTIKFSEDEVRAVAGPAVRAAREIAGACLGNVAQCVLQLGEGAHSTELHQAVRYCDRGERLLRTIQEGDGDAKRPSAEDLTRLRGKLMFRKAKLQRRLCDFTGAVGTLRTLEASGFLDEQGIADVRNERRGIDEDLRPRVM